MPEYVQRLVATFTILGLFLQLVGLSIAVSGVHQMHTTLTSYPLAWRQSIGEAAADGLQWVRVRMFRRLPPTQVITEYSATQIKAHTEVFAEGRIGEPAPTATVEERLERLERYVRLLDEDIKVRHKAHDERHRGLASDLKTLRNDTRAEIGGLSADQDRMRTALAGSDGHSLRRTFVGLAITALGVALTLVEPVADLFSG